MKRYANRMDARRDENHAAIAALLRAFGIVVVDLNVPGIGDLLCGWRGAWHLLEIKNPDRPPSKRKLTPAQTRFHAEAAAQACTVHVTKNGREALAVFGITIPEPA